MFTLLLIFLNELVSNLHQIKFISVLIVYIQQSQRIKSWLVMVDRNQVLNRLALEKDQEVTGFIKSSFITSIIMFGMSSSLLSAQVLILLYTSLKYPTS